MTKLLFHHDIDYRSQDDEMVNTGTLTDWQRELRDDKESQYRRL